ncbi:MAG: sigma-70 family RNA polymerase sigma factor [Planctomycetales bacterium]|nr:sigma-70 family RNA polymerase sigma factor [Planctomycetales bacterium]
MDNEQLERQLIEGNAPQVLGQLFLNYQERLSKIVHFRMDGRLRSRIDVADVLQEAFLEATQRVQDYRDCSNEISFFLWLRFIVLQKLTQLHRHHLGVQARDANRDVPIFARATTQATSVVLAAQLLGKITSPSGAAIREENKRNLEAALGQMESIDREVLALRHFEHLSNSETARLLELSESAACNRYFRAVRRLKTIMEQIHGPSGIFSRTND